MAVQVISKTLIYKQLVIGRDLAGQLLYLVASSEGTFGGRVKEGFRDDKSQSAQP
jgi:hypothetical protein